MYAFKAFVFNGRKRLARPSRLWTTTRRPIRGLMMPLLCRGTSSASSGFTVRGRRTTVRSASEPGSVP